METMIRLMMEMIVSVRTIFTVVTLVESILTQIGMARSAEEDTFE